MPLGEGGHIEAGRDRGQQERASGAEVREYFGRVMQRLLDTGRVRYTCCRDDEALAAFGVIAKSEGILPALESSHAIAEAMEIAAGRKSNEVVAVCLSGRGDKDAAEVARLRGEQY